MSRERPLLLPVSLVIVYVCFIFRSRLESYWKGYGGNVGRGMLTDWGAVRLPKRQVIAPRRRLLWEYVHSPRNPALFVVSSLSHLG